MEPYCARDVDTWLTGFDVFLILNVYDEIIQLSSNKIILLEIIICCVLIFSFVLMFYLFF